MMNQDRDTATNVGCTLGNPRTVARLLAIVTGTCEGMAHGAVPAVADAEPVVQRMPRWDGHTLEIERTPRGIRELRDEGIIAAATPWKRPPP